MRTLIQKLEVSDLPHHFGLSNKHIHKVITNKIIKHFEEKRVLVLDDKIYEWHFVNKDLNELPKELLDNSIEIKPLKKTEKLEILKKQLEELENEEEEEEETEIILEKPKKEKPAKVDKRKIQEKTEKQKQQFENMRKAREAKIAENQSFDYEEPQSSKVGDIIDIVKTINIQKTNEYMVLS